MKNDFVLSAGAVRFLSFNSERKTSSLSRFLALAVLGAFLFFFCCGNSQAQEMDGDDTSGTYSNSENFESDFVFAGEGAMGENASVDSSALTETGLDDSQGSAGSGTGSSFIEAADQYLGGFLHQHGIENLEDIYMDPFKLGVVSLGVLFLVGIVLPVLYRMLLGASPSYLLKTRFYEIPCLRVMFPVVKFFCFLYILEGLILTGIVAYKMFENGWDVTLGVQAGIMLAITVIMWLLVHFIVNPFVKLPDPIPPCNDSVRRISRSCKVSRKYLKRLGKESFPEMLIYGKRLGLFVRKVLFTLQITPFILLAILFAIQMFEVDKEYEWAQITSNTISMIFAVSIKYIMDFMAGLPAFAPEIAVPVFVCCAFLFIFLMREDKSYLILRFPTMLFLVSSLAFGLFYCFCMVYEEIEQRLIFLGILDLMFISRFYGDLKRASHFLKEHRVMKPIAENFAQIFPQAAEIKHRHDCELAEMDMDEVALRIEKGLHNVEKYSFMALRNMIRFIGIVHVEQERFAAVRIRFMTVSRYVTDRCLGGTYSFCHWPTVPYWDEVLFPLNPPEGYQTIDDYNWLGSEWNGVRTCSTCGGTGKVARTETYTERDCNGNEKTKTRTVYETCSTCGGSGRLEYQQAIVTQWKKQVIVSVEPKTSLPEYMADAEDRTYYSMRLIEDREKLHELADVDRHIGDDLVKSLDYSAKMLKETQLDNYVHSIEKYHDGRVYRSQVQAVGFWTLRIIFRRFFGKFGWFFGRNSDFYFRTIPLSLQSLLAVGVMLPLFIVIAVIIFALATSISLSITGMY